MTSRPWQFSLRTLFLLVTLVAGATALVANYPSVVLLTVVLALSLLLGDVMSLLVARVPVVARWSMVLCGAGFFGLIVWLGVGAYRDEKRSEWSFWIIVAALCYFGILCFAVAWTVPNKEGSDRLSARRIRRDEH